SVSWYVFLCLCYVEVDFRVFACGCCIKNRIRLPLSMSRRCVFSLRQRCIQALLAELSPSATSASKLPRLPSKVGAEKCFCSSFRLRNFPVANSSIGGIEHALELGTRPAVRQTPLLV